MTIYTLIPMTEIQSPLDLESHLGIGRLVLTPTVREWVIATQSDTPYSKWTCSPDFDYSRPITAPGRLHGRPVVLYRLKPQVWIRGFCPTSDRDQFGQMVLLDF